MRWKASCAGTSPYNDLTRPVAFDFRFIKSLVFTYGRKEQGEAKLGDAGSLELLMNLKSASKEALCSCPRPQLRAI